MSTRRERIMDVVSDITVNLLYYDRKEDEHLGVGGVESAIASGDVSIDEIVAIIRRGLDSAMETYRDKHSAVEIELIEVLEQRVERFESLEPDARFIAEWVMDTAQAEEVRSAARRYLSGTVRK